MSVPRSLLPKVVILTSTGIHVPRVPRVKNSVCFIAGQPPTCKSMFYRASNVIKVVSLNTVMLST